MRLGILLLLFANSRQGLSGSPHDLSVLWGRRKRILVGSLVHYEPSKVNRAALITTVAELYGIMQCVGACQFPVGLYWLCQAMRSPRNCVLVRAMWGLLQAVSIFRATRATTHDSCAQKRGASGSFMIPPMFGHMIGWNTVGDGLGARFG